jgi:hypothetical protein
MMCYYTHIINDYKGMFHVSYELVSGDRNFILNEARSFRTLIKWPINSGRVVAVMITTIIKRLNTIEPSFELNR